MPTFQCTGAWKKRIKINKLCYDNFHVWKPLAQLVLYLNELDELIKEDPTTFDLDDYEKWHLVDKWSKTVIRLTL